MATPKDLPRDIGSFIRDLRSNAKISLRQLAEQAGVSNPYLSQIERGLRKPSAEVLAQIASALRVSTPAMYLRAGLLADEDGHGVLAAIATDPDLTMAQKQSLSQIYETFRRENARHGETAAGAPTAAGDDQPTPTPTAGTPAEAVLESVAVTEAGAAPAPATSTTPAKKTTAKKATKAVRKAAPRTESTAPAVEEENR